MSSLIFLLGFSLVSLNCSFFWSHSTQKSWNACLGEWCAGKLALSKVSITKENRKSWFFMFAHFPSINTTTVADFTLLMDVTVQILGRCGSHGLDELLQHKTLLWGTPNTGLLVMYNYGATLKQTQWHSEFLTLIFVSLLLKYNPSFWNLFLEPGRFSRRGFPVAHIMKSARAHISIPA